MSNARFRASGNKREEGGGGCYVGKVFEKANHAAATAVICMRKRLEEENCGFTASRLKIFVL